MIGFCSQIHPRIKIRPSTPRTPGRLCTRSIAHISHYTFTEYFDTSFMKRIRHADAGKRNANDKPRPGKCFGGETSPSPRTFDGMDNAESRNEKKSKDQTLFSSTDRKPAFYIVLHPTMTMTVFIFIRYHDSNTHTRIEELWLSSSTLSLPLSIPSHRHHRQNISHGAVVLFSSHLVHLMDVVLWIRHFSP